MAPFIQDSDISLSFSDGVFDPKSIAKTPLHLSNLTESQTRLRPRKRVSFNEMATTHEIMSRYDYTADELEASFFDANDMKRMKEDARFDGRLLDANKLSLENSSSRGVEHRTREGFKRKKQSRLNAYAAVFFEIDYQQQECFDNEDAIADAYYTYSEPCAVFAHSMGKRDEIEARKIHNEESEEPMSF